MQAIATPRPAEVARMTGAEVRDSFLVSGLFEPGAVRLVLTGLDRMALGGAMPGPDSDLALPDPPEFGTRFFTERRELGLINIGDPGCVSAGGARFHLDRLDCLYIGSGQERVVFHAAESGQPVYYLLSCPAHRALAAKKTSPADSRTLQTGDEEHASRRRIVQCIHPDGVESCQLVMGYTELAPGSVWNTMPPHTHSRRSEIYFYFDLTDNIVVHLLGEPGHTRHLIVRDRQAALSPPWSIHSGVGTSSYRFIWGMAGENQEFGDMDPVSLEELK